MNARTLVVGGTRGSGLAFARLLADTGRTVTVLGRRPPLEELPTGTDYLQADLSRAEELDRVLKDFAAQRGPVSYLAFFQRFRGDGDSWTSEIDITLDSTRRVMDALDGAFAPEGDKAVLLVGSPAATLIAGEQPLGYHVAKAGLVQMARYYAVALGRRGIRVNCLSPGAVLKRESEAFYLSNQELLDLYAQIVPLGRMGHAEEIARAALFLLSPESSYITGQNIVADGGLSLLWQEGLARRLTALEHPGDSLGNQKGRT